jgi:hypothetical protein
VKLEDFNGRGVEVSIAGEIWTGYWKHGKRDGLVRYINEYGSELHDCEWKDDKLNGRCVKAYKDVGIKDGNYDNDKEHGE